MRMMGREKTQALKNIKELFNKEFLHFGEHQARPIPVTINRLDAELALHFTLAILNYFTREVVEANKTS